VIVRGERADDHAAIAAVVEAAFGSPDEARLVESFRASAGYLPELAHVARVTRATCNRLLLDERDARTAPRTRSGLGGGPVERDERPRDLPRRISPESADSEHEHLLFIGRSADPL